MKTLEEIKKEVATERNATWEYMTDHYRDKLWPEVCRRFARAALENAAKNVKTMDQWTGTVNITVISRSSITDERNIPKI